MQICDSWLREWVDHGLDPLALANRLTMLGIEVDSPDEMLRWQKRLTEQGLVKLVESDTKCCFARQDKVWFTDPDGNAWEVFYVYEQLPVTEMATCCG